MSVERAWLFLIGAGRVRDYRVLIAPDFLVAGKEYGRLKDLAQPGPEERSQHARLDARAGELTLCYRTRGTDIRDGQGRAIHLIYGYVFRGGHPAQVADAEFDRAVELAMPVFRSFLGDERAFTVHSSRSAPLNLDRSEGQRTSPLPPGRKLTFAGVVATMAVAAIGALFLRPTGNEDALPPAAPIRSTGTSEGPALCEPSRPHAIILSPNGQAVAVIERGNVTLCDRENHVAIGPSHQGRKALFKGDGTLLAVLSDNGVSFINTAKGEQLPSPIKPAPLDVTYDPTADVWRVLLADDQVEEYKVDGGGAHKTTESTPQSAGG